MNNWSNECNVKGFLATNRGNFAVQTRPAEWLYPIQKLCNICKKNLEVLYLYEDFVR